MKPYLWNEAKNAELKNTRKVSFEDVVEQIEVGDLLARWKNPNIEKYPGQEFFIVMIRGYVYAVPFVEDEDKVFLKTIFPSRKLNRKFLGWRKPNS